MQIEAWESFSIKYRLRRGFDFRGYQKVCFQIHPDGRSLGCQLASVGCRCVNSDSTLIGDGTMISQLKFAPVRLRETQNYDKFEDEKARLAKLGIIIISVYRLNAILIKEPSPLPDVKAFVTSDVAEAALKARSVSSGAAFGDLIPVANPMGRSQETEREKADFRHRQSPV